MSLQNIVEQLKYRNVTFKPAFRHWNYAHTSIVVVGCGGTGGRLIPILTQHIANHNNHISTAVNTDNVYLKHKMRLALVDMDEVETKNLKRQNFYSFDVGKNKAECLAERYSALYGMDIAYFSSTFDEAVKTDRTNSYNNSAFHNAENIIIFDCTDNRAARESIEKFCNGNVLLISCGNEDTFGQVAVSTPYERNISAILREFKDPVSWFFIDHAKTEPSTNSSYVTILPSLLTMYPFFKDSETAGCTDMVLQNEQSMPINMLVAQLAYNVFYDIVSGKTINYNIVKCNINNTFSTSLLGNSKTYVDKILRILIQDLPATPVTYDQIYEFRNVILANIGRYSYSQEAADTLLRNGITLFGPSLGYTILKHLRELNDKATFHSESVNAINDWVTKQAA